jgi:hypothetical protein
MVSLSILYGLQRLSYGKQKMIMRSNTRWTYSEISYIKTNYLVQSASEMAQFLGRTERAVRGIMYRENLVVNHRREWTPEEEDQLRELAMNYHPSDIARKLNRTETAITTKMSKLRITKELRR